MHATSTPLNNDLIKKLKTDLRGAAEGAIEAHEEDGFEGGGGNPVINRQATKVPALGHAGALSYSADGVLPLTKGSYVEPSTGRFRTELFDCFHFPHCLVAWAFPWVIWAQAHKALHGGADPDKGMCGYYVIMGSYIAMTFILSLAGANSIVPFFFAVESLYSIVGMFILVSLLRRARKKYNIHGNHCQACCCGCFSDGCYDLLKACCCPLCATFQLGHHLFDYATNTEITYEAIPTVEYV